MSRSPAPTAALALATIVGLVAGTACAADERAEGVRAPAAAPGPGSAPEPAPAPASAPAPPPAERPTDAKALAYELLPVSVEAPPAAETEVDECPLAAGETVPCVTVGAWTTAVPVRERRALFVRKARSSGWKVSREESLPSGGHLVYLARPRYRARIGLEPDDPDCTPCAPVRTEILVAGPRAGSSGHERDAGGSNFAAGATRTCRDLLRLSRRASTLSPRFLEGLRRGLADLEGFPPPRGLEAETTSFLEALRRMEAALRTLDDAAADERVAAGAAALERAQETAVAARELGLADCARLF